MNDTLKSLICKIAAQPDCDTYVSPVSTKHCLRTCGTLQWFCYLCQLYDLDWRNESMACIADGADYSLEYIENCIILAF